VRARSPLLPIFLIVLVDVLGFTIVIPLLPLYAERFGASPLVATTIVSCYALCSLISTPIIGHLSDRYGRKRLLLFSQAGTCAAFLMLGLANALWMVFLGRIIDGITAGNLATAQAYISDHTKPEERTKAFGLIGIAFGIGFMVGPALGGVLGDYGVRQIGDVPFLVSACLSALSMVCTGTLLTSERPPQATGDASGPGGRRPSPFDFSLYAEYFRRPELAALYGRFFLFTFSFSAFTSGFALFAEQRFGWSVRETGYLFAYAGSLGVIWQRSLGPLVKRFGEPRLAAIAFCGAVLGYALLGFAQTLVVLVVAATINSFGNGVARPVLTSQITQACARHEQGIALGISGSISSLAMSMAPPCGGLLLNHHWTHAWTLVPMTVAALGLLSAFIAARRGRLAAPPNGGAPVT
jgi:MFS transporter, DHA1 family, tetracycline resistance protein